MDTSPWFDDAPVIGELPPEQAVAKLREIGEDDTAEMLEMAQEAESKAFGFGIPKSWPPFVDKPWKPTTHEFGYLAPAQPGSDPLPIRPIGN